MLFKVPVALFALFAVSMPVQAERFRVVKDRSEFVSLISGRQLTRSGIRLQVTPSGGIAGRGFGRPVTGDWAWKGGFFCRDLYWGKRDLGFNCQMVKVDGDTLRFISDQGAGQFADLRLQ